MLIDTAARVFGIDDNFKITDLGSRLALDRGDHLVEVEKASAGVWAADRSRLFNPDVRPSLPPRDEAISVAEEIARSRALLPDLDAGFGFAEPLVAGTRLAINQEGQRSVHQLDFQVVFPIRVRDLPVVGGGGDFTLALGEGAI